MTAPNNPTPEVELVERLREILSPRHLQPKTNDLVAEVHALYADAISRLTAERDAAVRSADEAWDKCEDRRIEAHENWLRAETAEKRVKELEAELERITAIGDKIYEKELLDREEQVMATLSGKHKHYCMDWDGMAIDETCAEFEACTCLSASALSSPLGEGEREAVENGERQP